jgi:hypothetical protein
MNLNLLTCCIRQDSREEGKKKEKFLASSERAQFPFKAKNSSLCCYETKEKKNRESFPSFWVL